MALVAMCAEILRNRIVQALLKDSGVDTNRDRSLQMIEIRQNDEHLVSAVIGVPPALANRRIEKVCHQTVRVTSHGKLFFEYAGSLKFGETFQLVARKSAQKIQNMMSIDRNCGPKKGTDKRRARGDSGQI